MHIVLINPRFTFFGKSDIAFSQCLGLLYIGSYARSKGHRVTIIDALQEGQSQAQLLSEGLYEVGLSNAEIVARIPDDADLIGISAPFSHSALICHSLIEDIKEARSSTPVVMGGIFPSTQPRLAATSEADFLVLGEGEVPLVELADYLDRGSQGELPQGVVARTDPLSVENASPYHIADLDLLPQPDRELLPFERYLARSQRNRRQLRVASILTSRGCPFDCEFCSVHPVAGYRWRPHSPQYVLEGIDRLVQQYGINALEIEDDNFTLNSDRAVEILEGIVQRNRKGAGLRWYALNGLRIDTLSEELMRLAAESNCAQMNLALENGDEDQLESMRKKLDLTKALEVFRLVHKYHINCKVFVIYGYPGESRARFDNAVEYYRKVKKCAPGVEFYSFVAQPYPGTKLFERVVQEGYLPADRFATVEQISRFSTTDKFWIETPDFDRAELIRRGNVLSRSLCSRSLNVRRWLKGILPDRLVDLSRSAYHYGKSRMEDLRRPPKV